MPILSVRLRVNCQECHDVTQSYCHFISSMVCCFQLSYLVAKVLGAFKLETIRTGALVGPTRFELVTFCTPSKRATRLRYGPMSPTPDHDW